MAQVVGRGVGQAERPLETLVPPIDAIRVRDVICLHTRVRPDDITEDLQTGQDLLPGEIPIAHVMEADLEPFRDQLLDPGAIAGILQAFTLIRAARRKRR